MREYACRALAYELAEPSLEERPELVLGLVRDQLSAGFDLGTAEALARRREAAAQAARESMSCDDMPRFERALSRALAA